VHRDRVCCFVNSAHRCAILTVTSNTDAEIHRDDIVHQRNLTCNCMALKLMAKRSFGKALSALEDVVASELSLCERRGTKFDGRFMVNLADVYFAAGNLNKVRHRGRSSPPPCIDACLHAVESRGAVVPHALYMRAPWSYYCICVDCDRHGVVGCVEPRRRS
jgi:hypothetical protein